MSRIGKKPIEIPAGVEVKISDKQVKVKGPKGELSLTLHSLVSATTDGKHVQVDVVRKTSKEEKSLWGLSARLILSMILGVTKGYQKQLDIQGIGYKAAVKGSDALELNIGYTHVVVFKLPDGIKAGVEKNVITISGIDKQKVGDTAARIRSLAKPEPYKGKGIRYLGEVITLKPGKAATKGAAAA